MDKQEAIQLLISIKDEFKQAGNFRGKASIIRNIGNDIQFLIKYKVGGNVPRLFVEKYSKQEILTQRKRLNKYG